MKKFVWMVAVLFAFGLGATRMVGQGQDATVVGTVTDASGAVLPDAVVVVTNPSKGFKQQGKTNSHGEYTVPLLPPAAGYVVTVTKDGFSTFVRKGIELTVAESEKIDVSLKPGTETSVSVDSDAIQVDTQTSSLGQTIAGDTVADLPLNGRSTFRLIELTPGVTFSDSAQGQFGDVPVNTTWDSTFSINGGRTQSNEFLIDGIPTATGLWNQITTMPIVDELQEFRVQSNNLSAQYGRYSGGVINVVTKSGTNSIHGDVFEFLRNDVLDAYDWFTHNQHVQDPSVTKDSFKMNQYGGVVGGPVTIPHLYSGHDRTFFFLSFQGTSRIKGDPTYYNVPTDAQRAGNFGTINIYNPYTYGAAGNRTQFTNNTIPSSMIDPVGQYIIKNFYPEPNVPSTIAAGTTTNNYFDNLPTRVTQFVPSLRIDQNVTNRWHMFGRYEYSLTNLEYPNHYHNIATPGSSAVGKTHWTNQSFAWNNTVTLSPTVLLNVSYGFARWYQYKGTLSYGFDTSTFPSANWAQIHSTPGMLPAFPNMSVTGYAGLSGQVFINNGNDSHAVLAQLTKVWGLHEFNLGFDVRMHRINQLTQSNPGGAFTFNQQNTRLNNTATTNGNSVASMLLGAAVASSANTITIPTGTELQDFYYAGYLQDNWRILPKLTLNLGVRYDYESPYLDRFNELNYFDHGIHSAAANTTFPNLAGGLVFANTNGLGRSVYNRDKLNFVPRIGFAYSPNNDIVFRGGFGISYAPLELTNNATGFAPNQGYSSQTIMNSYTPVKSTNGTSTVVPKDLLTTPFPAGLKPITGSALGTLTQLGANINTWYRNPPTPYAEQWNFDTQFTLPGHTLLDVGYAGSAGVHLTAPFNLNTLPFSQIETLQGTLTDPVANPFYGQVATGTLANTTTTRQQLLLPYPQFANVTEINTPWGHSTYNSAQVKFVKRDVKNITILVAYTWSKLMTNTTSGNAPIGSVDFSSVQDYYRLDLERAVSDLDIAHNFITHVVYQLPFGKGQRFINGGGWTDKLVGGWKMNVIWKEQDGIPLIPGVTSVTGGANRPDLVQGVYPKYIGKRDNLHITGKASDCAPRGVNGANACGWFNQASIAAPQAYFPGTMRKTWPDVRRPGIQNADVALIKDTRFAQRYHAQFRAEAFNVTNTPHFTGPAEVINGGGLGNITNTRTSPPEREFQFGLKIFF